MSSIEIFLSLDKTIELRVMLDDDTVWLTQAQLIELFQSSKANISEHIKNIFAEGELDRKPTVRKFRTVRAEGKRQVTREIEHYNLDLVLSIGYRVNSKRGTQFRQWASECLKQHLIKGYTINENRIKQLENGLFQLEHAVNLIHQSSQSDGIKVDEVKGLLEIITNYTRSFILLNQFDSNSLELEKLNENITYEISYEEAIEAIEELKKRLIKSKEASRLFGNQKDESFAGLLGSIVQAFGGQYVYSSIEEQAAHLLYFII